MTKLEAWHAWCTTAGTADLATKFTLEQSSHGKAFSFAWDAAVKAERKVCAEVCEDYDTGQDLPWDHAVIECAAAIRSRT